MQQVALGLKENWRQFTLLVIINGFVGGMIGLERSILPQIAEDEFQIAARSAMLSFIVVFGVTKAFTNYYTGTWANRIGRKKLLMIGWIIAIPVPFILMYAPDWNWIVAANILLGIHQGLAWSSTVIMKIDLVGDKNRGLAMGINESAGYVAVAVVAFLTGWIASEYGLRPYPFIIGIFLTASGLLMTLLFIRDTRHHVSTETAVSSLPRLTHIFRQTTWSHRNLGSITQAGLVNNLNDGMVWGIFPILLASRGFDLHQIGIVTAVYPGVWGLGQLITGKMSDTICKKDMMYTGMMVQAIALILLLWAGTFIHFIGLSVLLGWGTAMVYPTFLASIAENTHPLDRARSIGVFRLWRDLGYAFGAILTGIIADRVSLTAAIFFIAILTGLSAMVIRWRMKCAGHHIQKLWQWVLLQKPKDDQHSTCITTGQLTMRMAQSEPFIIVDVRSPDEYQSGHIPNAVNIPLPQLSSRIRTMDRKKSYVTVCTSGGGRSAEAASLLRNTGFKAQWLCGGTSAWQSSVMS